jgi:hypothetical protein
MVPLRNFIKIVLITSMTFIVVLSGCSAERNPGAEDVEYTQVLEQWITALNDEDITQFEQLHTETVTYSSHIHRSPHSGRENLWESIHGSNSSQLEKLSAFGQDETICLQVSETDSKKSFLYIFEFERGLISHIYSYSAEYDLSTAPVSEGEELTTDDSKLAGRIGVINSQAEFLNDRDFSGFLTTFNDEAVLYVPPSRDPVIGIDGIRDDVQDFVQNFPAVELDVFRTIGQGNLVCQQISVTNGPMRSLGFVNVFNGEKVSRVYEYLSQAEIGD